MRKKAFVGLFLTVAFLTLLLLSGCGAAKPEENTDNKVITMLTAATPSDSFYYGLRRWTKGYTIKQPNMDCQPTEITALMRHRAVFS